MKSYGNLWPRITSFENLYEAFRAARGGKRHRPDVAAYEFDLETNLLALQRESIGEPFRAARQALDWRSARPGDLVLGAGAASRAEVRA